MTARVANSNDLPSLEVLYETRGLPDLGLADELVAAYGGPLGFPATRLFASLVAGIDGVAALPDTLPPKHAFAARGTPHRFVTGLLRACADAVLIGSGTLRASPGGRWTASDAYPPAAALYAELRRLHGRPPEPTLAVLSGSGEIDPRHPALGARTLILTSEQGAARLGRRLPRTATIVPIGGQSPCDPVVAVEALQNGGHALILCEGGPTLVGALTGAGLVDELFLTLAPLLAGAPRRGQALSLLGGVRLPTGRAVDCRLLSLRRADSQLFLRYELIGGTDDEDRG
jgi:riboflavin biosynthesis pyrimidine reductase